MRLLHNIRRELIIATHPILIALAQ